METRTERDQGPDRRTTIVLCVAIAAVAIWVRFWRLSWGLPEQPGFPDEAWIFNKYASAFTSLSWDSFQQRSPLYPTLYGYLVGLTAVSLRAVGILHGKLLHLTPEAFIAGRTVSAMAGLATVGLVGFVACRMYSRRVGLAAAALMAVTPFQVMYGHIASTDATLGACAALTMVCAYAAGRSGRIAAVIATGMAAGFAFSTKYTGLAMIVLGGWVVLERWAAERSFRRALVIALVVAAGFVGGVTLACPPCVFTPGTMLDGMRTLRFQTTWTVAGLTNNHLTPALGWYGRPYLFQLVAELPFSLGWPLYVASLAGVGVALWRREQADRLLLVGVGALFFSLGASRAVPPRYLMPIFPGLVILAARALLVPQRPAWLGRGLLACVWLYSMVLTTTQIARFSFDQQRSVAAWIAAYPHEGRRMRTVGYPWIILDYYRLEQPLHRAGLKAVAVKEGKWFDDPPDFIVIPEWYEISIDRDRKSATAAKDLARIQSGEGGYRRGPHWRSHYLQDDFYTWLDPAYASDLWMGEIGFTVYIRDPDAAAGSRPAQAAAVPPPAPAGTPAR